MSTPTQSPPTTARALAPWFIAVVLHSYAVTLVTVAPFDYADKVLHASASTRLWLSAIWGFCYIFIALAAGKITSRLGAKKTLMIMLPLAILANLLCLFIFPLQSNRAAPWLLALLMIPLNITCSACWPALETAVSQSPAQTPLSTRMALYNLSWSVTGFAAIFTKGAFEDLHWSLIFIAPAVVTLITWLLLAFVAIPQSMLSKEHVPEESAHETDLDSPEMCARAKTLLHMAWIGNALAYVAINVLIPVLLLLASAAFTRGFTNNAENPSLMIAGFITSVWGFTRVAGFIFTMKWSGWHYKARWLIGAQLALALSFLAMLILHEPITFILLQILFGLATALIYSSSLYYAMHTSQGEGDHAGFHEALIGMGICLGPTIGAIAGTGAALEPAAQLAALHRIAYATTALLLLGTAVMAYLAKQNPERKPAEQVP